MYQNGRRVWQNAKLYGRGLCFREIPIGCRSIGGRTDRESLLC